MLTSGVAGTRKLLQQAYLRESPASVSLAFLCTLAAAIALRAFTFTKTGLDWDESLYIVMAQRWLHGDLPYVAVWDQHPIGLPALFAVAQIVITDGLLAARLLAVLAVSGTATLLYVILAREADTRMAGALAAALYLLYMTRPEGLAGNTEIFNNFVVTAAVALLMNETSRRVQAERVSRMFLAALLFGIGLQIKYVVAPEAVLFCCLALALVWQRGGSNRRTACLAGVAILGGLLPTAAATLYFWQAGALQPYLDANILANITYVRTPLGSQTLPERLRAGLVPFTALLPWPLLLAFLLRHKPDPATRRTALWLLVWLVAASIDVIAPLKFWKHYFNALLPPLSLAAGLAMVLLARRFGRRRTAAVAVITAAVAVPAILLMVKHATISRNVDGINVPREVAERIRQVGTDGGDVYVFNYDPLIYSYADVAPPTRFVLGIELATASASSGARPLQEIDTILGQEPAWIVVAAPSLYKFAPAVLQRLHAALRDYQLDRSWRDDDRWMPFEVRLYRRTGSVIRYEAVGSDSG